MRRVPWSLLILLAAAILLLAGLLVFRTIPRETPDEDDWYIMVSGSVQNGGRFHIDEMQDIGKVEFTMSLLGTSEDGEEHRYKGIALSTLLHHCIINNGSTRCTVRASDAYSTSFSLSEDQLEGIYLAWEKDGKALKSRSDGGPGPVRLMVPQDIAGEFNAQRCVKYVSEVIVQ